MRTIQQVRVLSAAALFFLATSAVAASPPQELYPDNNVSARHFVEFRARGPAGPLHTGHAFVVLGVERDNGLRQEEAVGGFYPDAKGLDEVLKVVLPVPGKVDFRANDIHSDVFFRTYVTEDQASEVKFDFSEWNEKQYALASQNCVSLATAVARSLDLKVPGGMDTLSQPQTLWPVPFVRFLAEHNSSDQTSSYTAQAHTDIDASWAKLSQVLSGPMTPNNRQPSRHDIHPPMPNININPPSPDFNGTIELQGN